MPIPERLICSSHTISGVMPGEPIPARHGFEARLAACARAGYSGLCLHFRDFRALRAAGWEDARLADALRAHGFADVGIEFLTGWHLEGRAGEAARADEACAFAAARAYGARILNVGGDFERPGTAPEIMRRRFAGLCERAGDRGLSVALEIAPWSNVADVPAALALIEGLPNAGLVIDCWHVFRGGIALGEIERLPGERILCIQINDAEAAPRGPLGEDTLRRKPCGEGAFDLAGFLAALERAGASVPASVEIISVEFAALDVETAARRSIEGARRLLAARRG